MKLFLRLFDAVAIICLGIVSTFLGCGEDKKIASPDSVVEDGDTVPAVWKLEIAHDIDVILGHYHDVDMTLAANSAAIGGFDLLITYDNTVLTFVQASLGQYFLDCGWEYFTYRYWYVDTCGPDCPRSLIRLVGMAETNNGAVHPDVQCILDGGEQILATLTFYVSGDRMLECTKHPIRFYWFECGDNTISTYSGDSLAINLRIYDSDSTRIEDSLAVFPGYVGASDSSCLLGEKIVPFRGIDLVNGSIDFLCAESLDVRGDLNLNGWPNEIADAVLYTDYFLHGISVFEPHVYASTVASDVNGDGQTLTLSDLEYLIRIIQGDALPNPPPLPDTTATVLYHNGHVYLDSPADVGAIFLIFDLNAIPGEPTLTVPDMSIKHSIYSDELRVLIYDIGSGYIPAGAADILTVPATATLISAEAAAYEGNSIHVTIYSTP